MMEAGIQISQLAIRCRIGVHAWEQCIDQRLLLDLELPCTVGDCAEDLAKTIDYAAVAAFVTDFVQHKSFRLIETVAETVALGLRDQFGIKNAKVTVKKPHALRDAAGVAATFVLRSA